MAAKYDGQAVGGLQITEQLEEPFLKGKVQDPAFRDVWFGYAFVAQIIGVAITAVIYGPMAFDESLDDVAYEKTDDNNSSLDASKFLFILIATLLGVILSSMGMMAVMTKYSASIVEVSFCSAPILLCLTGVIFMAAEPTVGAFLLFAGAVFGAISACVYLCYKRFIPFAASTLRTALSAVQVHRGLFVVSLGSQAAAFITSVVFIVSIMGLYAHAEKTGGKVRCKDLYEDTEGDYSNDDMCLKNPPIFGVFALLFCSFWTQQVIQNVVHCTTAGTVGTWWFARSASPSLCSQEITGSFGRATTYSFGSICFGSLLVAILQTLEEMARSARRNRDGALLACVLECILSCMRAWLEYFNSWAFVYVGLYGYDYLTAGTNVIKLFENHGWSTFVSDRLIFRVLYFNLLTVSLVGGGVATLADAMIGPTFDQDAGVSYVFSFGIGFVVGLILSSCSMFVIESAVRTVIICFAESPADFSIYHPVLCETMKAGWAAAYPDTWTEEYDLRFAEVLGSTNLDEEGGEERKALVV